MAPFDKGPSCKDGPHPFHGGEGLTSFSPALDKGQQLSFFADLCISPSLEELREGPEILDDIRP